MKKILASLGILSLVLVVIAPVLAAEEGVSCTVTPKLIALTVDDGNVDYGPLDVDSEKSTKDLGDNQTVTNTGNVNEKIEVKTSNATGGTQWTVGASAGSDIFVHSWAPDPDQESPAWTDWSAVNTYATLNASLPHTTSNTQLLGLKIHTPTSTTDHVQKSITVTVLATEAGA